MVKGRIHSIESMGLVDGPGIRTVVFFQGCKLRCLYCHNPDTWNMAGGKEYTAEEILKKIIRFKPYFDRSNGGVTFSGGEVLLQPEFLLEILKLCKKNNIHTTIDTAGYGNGNYEEILKYTDLVLLDIKQVDDESYKSLTGKGKNGVDEFLRDCEKMKTKLWIRHVVVPGITDSKEHIDNLAKIIKNIKNVDRVELLPYHTLGVDKYNKLDIDYRLKGTDVMDDMKCKELEEYLRNKL
ncbi:pyruvate formate lyase activating enzyme [Clostridium acidisoli DSM 12555]|jgi:pyruvate formate lyase activating enzyme|uniref:Pyruvate formate-lyase-activating enzyme n=1 Tax=Clostridium acidisoli DSM 12555 TaxID=1121291 RepID=A0A1W1XZH2_9CLOT|nr:pyruvate formate-lyase-activating protein [Clostridium acidisoli]SMC29313.1 pyruvate formate lyase activating enzyme [Clostridium acidisoli DSM 12555]